MIKRVRNNKGWTMPIVVIIVTVMVMLAVVLMNNVMQSFHFTNSQENIGDAFFAGESALEKWFCVIGNTICDADFASSYTDEFDPMDNDHKEKYVEYVIDKIKNEINDNGFSPQLIDISGGASSPSDYAEVKINDLLNKTTSYEVDASNEMWITIGIQASANYNRDNSRYSAINQKIYGQYKYKVAVPEKDSFELLGPIYSVADLYVDGAKAEIKGDPYVFGSFPEMTLQPEQWYYGGIFVLNKSDLTIDGNAYTRGLIRTGKYLQDEDDSWVWIKRDAIAQGIHLFGDGDRIVVYKNAYTFDDLEINGENGLIAINGSYVGLSSGSRTHDDSSAVVNSSIIHNLYSEASLSSGIVINGDAIIRGGTFKIAEEGKAVGQIEDASVAWSTIGGFGNAYYKANEDAFDGMDFDEYHIRLNGDYKMNPGKIGGFSDLFQIWGVQEYDKVEDWVKGDVITYLSGKDKNNPLDMGALSVGDDISGYWNYELAANGRIYTNEPLVDIKKFQYINANFVLDNIYKSKTELKYTEQIWADGSDDYWSDEDLEISGGKVKNLLNYKERLDGLFEAKGVFKFEDIKGCIKDDLLSLTHFFAERVHPGDSGKSEAWSYGDNEIFKNLLEKLQGLAISPANKDKEHLLYIPYDSTMTGEEDIDVLYKESLGEELTLYGRSDDDYYLIINENPDLTLSVNDKFNGIIFTVGEVNLYDGADIWGSVIAGGCADKDGELKLDELKVTSGNVNNLNDGTMAGIRIIGDDTKDNIDVSIDFYLGCTPYVDFGAGSWDEPAYAVGSDKLDTDNDFLNRAARARLLQKFENVELNLRNIF